MPKGLRRTVSKRDLLGGRSHSDEMLLGRGESQDSLPELTPTSSLEASILGLLGGPEEDDEALHSLEDFSTETPAAVLHPVPNPPPIIPLPDMPSPDMSKKDGAWPSMGRRPHKLKVIPEARATSTFSHSSGEPTSTSPVDHSRDQPLGLRTQPDGTLIQALRVPIDSDDTNADSKPIVVAMKTVHRLGSSTSPVGLRLMSDLTGSVRHSYERMSFNEPLAAMRKQLTGVRQDQSVGERSSKIKKKAYDDYKYKTLTARSDAEFKHLTGDEEQYFGGLENIERGGQYQDDFWNEVDRGERKPKWLKGEELEMSRTWKKAKEESNHADDQNLAPIRAVKDGWGQEVNIWYWYEAKSNHDKKYSYLVKLHPDEISEDGQPVFDAVPTNWYWSRLIWDRLMICQPSVRWKVHTWGLPKAKDTMPQL